MPEVDSEKSGEFTKYGVQCRCHDATYVPKDDELVKEADGSMSCPHCGQTFLFRGKKPEGACSDAKD
ncbi:MAG: hypothetical protein ABFE07_29405 [Armatimonadia bacterium]